MPEQALHRIMMLPFYHPFPGEGRLLAVEQQLRLGLEMKLTLFSQIALKHFGGQQAMLASTSLNMPLTLQDEALSGALQQRLQQVAQQQDLDYMLTGSIHPRLDVDNEEVIRQLEVTLNLFDATKKRFALDVTYVIDQADLSENPQSTVGFSTLALPAQTLNALINWASILILQVVSPTQRLCPLEQMSQHQLIQSLEAFQRFVRAEDPATPTEKRLLHLEQALSQDPALELGYYHLGKLYQQHGQYHRAGTLYAQALAVSHGSQRIKALYANEQGLAMALIHDYDEAIRAWERAIVENPGFLAPYLSIALAYEDRGDLGQATRYFEQAKQLAPGDLRIIYNLARVYSKQDCWDRAIAQYEEVLLADEEDASNHTNLATCYLQLGNTQQAKQHLQRAYELSPHSEAGEYASMVLGELLSSR